jgi:glycosyltransferase involved in cell wall biosynthesis
MKIVQVQTQAEAAGAQRVSDMVGEGLRRRGHTVRTVFLYRKTDVYDDDPNSDFILKERPHSKLAMLGAVAGLWRYLRREQPDAVIAYQHFGNVAGAVGAHLAGCKVVIANQSGAPFKGGLPGVASLVDRVIGSLGLYQHNVVNSAWTEAQFAPYPARYRRRLVRIDHGVMLPPHVYGRNAARSAFGLPITARLVVSSGRLTAVKNFAAIVRCLPLLKGVHLAIAGVGPESEALLAEARSLGVAERLHLVGEVPPQRIHEFLATGEVYAFASLTETFGLSAAEAAVSGLPIVANDLPVLREVLSDTEGRSAALFAAENDTAAFTAAIARVLAEPLLAGQLGAVGMRLANRYSPQVMADAYARLLEPALPDGVRSMTPNLRDEA